MGGGQASVAFAHRRLIVERRGLAALGVGIREQHAHVVIDQLEAIGVAGEDQRFNIRRRRLAGEGADHIIGLKTCRNIDRQIERRNQRLDAGQLRVKLLGRGGAASLIVGIKVIAESTAHIKGDGGILGVVRFEGCQQNLGKTEDRVGRLAA